MPGAPSIVLKVVSNRVPQVNAELRRGMSQLVRRTAFDIEARAKTKAPVRTGNLRNSIQTTMESDLTATVGTAVEYAAPVELGHHTRGGGYVPPRPFLGPAVDEARPVFERAMRALLR